MKIEDYIASGIIEAYLLGQLSEKEQREFEQKLSVSEELRNELSRLEEDILWIDNKLSVAPPVGLKEKISSQLFIDTVSSDNEPLIEGNKIRQLRAYQWVAAASVVIALVAGVFAVQYRYQYLEANERLINLLDENDRVTEQFNQATDKVEDYERIIEKVYSPEFSKITLAGLEISPDSRAVVFWNASGEEVYISIGNLPQNAQDKQYQLWAIVDGQPVDAGIFDAKAEEAILIKMKDIGSAQAFAVTLEPRGGSKNPTLDQMYLLGKAG